MATIAQAQFTIVEVLDGVSTATLSLELPDGNTFQGNNGSPKKINVIVREGGVDVTINTSTNWYFNGVIQNGLTNLKSLDIYPADVLGGLTIKVIATYNGTTYQDSVNFLDLDDVYQVSMSGNDKIKNSEGSVTYTAIVFRGSSQIFNGFRCRWTNVGIVPPTVIYEGINTTGTLEERGVTITITPDQIDGKLDLLCELSVDTVEQELDVTEEQLIPSYDSKAYAAAMSIALS